MDAQKYAVFVFPSVSHALKAEKILKARGTPHKLIPVPRHISADCGVCLRVAAEQQGFAAEALQGLVAWERMVLL
jgi:Protein of unknown function (DUF3343)